MAGVRDDPHHRVGSSDGEELDDRLDEAQLTLEVRAPDAVRGVQHEDHVGRFAGTV